MRTLVFICLLVLLALSPLAEGRWWRRRPRPTHAPTTALPQPQAGEPCRPNYAATCGNRRLVNTVVTPINSSRYGPNVCIYEKTYEVSTSTYAFQRLCSRWGGCWMSCASTGECNGTARNVTQRTTDCCEGFAASPSSQGSWYYRYHRSFLREEGCPIMLRDTVRECIADLALDCNLTQFEIQLLSAPQLNDALGDPNSTDDFTVFAFNNEAFNSLDEDSRLVLFGNSFTNQTMSTHVAEGLFPNSRLRHGWIIRPLAAGRLLHITDVDQFGRRYGYRTAVNERTFINGAEIVKKDACQARNGILHVVDSIIPASSLTLAQILDIDVRFDTFKRLLDNASITPFLNRTVSRTVFAPTDAAFDRLPEGAVDCLLRRENRWALKTLVLIHIIFPAEYNSSLSLRRYVGTFSGFYLMVELINGTVHLSRRQIPIEQADIPARNGVLHVLRDVIVPSCINFSRLCPDMSTTPTTTPTTSTTATTTATTSTTTPTTATTTPTTATTDTPSPENTDDPIVTLPTSVTDDPGIGGSGGIPISVDGFDTLQ